MIFTLFGATGDLTTKKIMPALYRLFSEDELPVGFKVICIGRRDYDTKAFVAHLESKMVSPYENWVAFKNHLVYYSMDFSQPDAFKGLKDLIEHSTRAQKIYYLATAPRFFPIIAEALLEHGLVHKGDMREKIVFEKPFGEDLESAIQYNKMLMDAISESQAYRIDHYLGKEMLQNILTVRFANKIFENIWDSEHIEMIKIYALEDEGVKERGGYYDTVGALKDMVQNHLLQTLALVAMDPPKGLNDQWVKNKKVEVLENIRVEEPVILGQYKNYVHEKGIPEDSKTETFVGLKVFVDTKRWRDMPFYLVTGKKMSEKRAGIEIVFKNADCFFEKGQPERNKLTIEIYPREGIVLQFNGKAPGLQAYTMPMKMDYCHACHVLGNTPEAYEKLILDVIRDEGALFTRWDEIEHAWRIVRTIEPLKNESTLYVYEHEKDMMAVLKNEWEGVDFEK